MYYLKLLRNVVIRKIVNTLLGDHLVIDITEAPDKRTFEIVDLRRRLPYGKWKICNEEKRTFESHQGVNSVTSLTVSKK